MTVTFLAAGVFVITYGLIVIDHPHRTLSALAGARFENMGKAEEEEARKRAQEEKARREAREQREREASKRAEEVMYLCFHSSPQKLLFVSPPYMVGLFCNR